MPTSTSGQAQTHMSLSPSPTLETEFILGASAARIAELERLIRVVEAGDGRTHGHSQRVMRCTEAMAQTMRLAPADVTRCLTAAAVHDIGKIFTPNEILNKPGPLTEAETAIVRRHPDDGAGLLDDVDDPQITAMVRHHHERLDGSGYPDGLFGDDIPLGARIIAVADTYDAMTSGRAYRPAGTERHALVVLGRLAGSTLDADAVAAFLHCHYARHSLRGPLLVPAY
jgi:HD-GYP domain-containing protein (c-di-GMP phosphodiesterase class II)